MAGGPPKPQPHDHGGCPIHAHRAWVGCRHRQRATAPHSFQNYDHLTVPTGLKRYQGSGHDHLVTFSCYRRRPYLDNDHARTVFLSTLEQLRQRQRFHVFGYVLMPEHLHMLTRRTKGARAGQHPQRPENPNFKTTQGRPQAVLADSLPRLECHHPSQIRRKATLHPPQPGKTRPGRQAARLAMEQLSSLAHRPTGTSRDRVPLDVGSTREVRWESAPHPPIAIEPRWMGHPAWVGSRYRRVAPPNTRTTNTVGAHPRAASSRMDATAPAPSQVSVEQR